MTNFVRVAPVNSLLFISDRSRRVVPDFIAGRLILSTPSCISVGCLMSQDGETHVKLGKAQDVDPGGTPAFDNLLETPNGTVIVSTVEQEAILEAQVPDVRTRVRIWVNRPEEPDQVIIGLG